MRARCGADEGVARGHRRASRGERDERWVRSGRTGGTWTRRPRARMRWKMSPTSCPCAVGAALFHSDDARRATLELHRSSLVSTEKTVGPMLTTRRGARCRELELSELPKTQTDSRTKSKRMASGPPIFADDDPRPRKFLDLHPDGRVKVTPPSRVCRRPARRRFYPWFDTPRRSFEGAVYVDASHQAR